MVMDIVYQPLETKLLQEAKQRGCATVSGLEMLMRQAAAQLEIWTGRRLEIGRIKKALLRVLEEAPLKTQLGGPRRGKGW